MTAETSQTLDRGLRVLYLLADCADGLSVAQLARELDVSRTIVYRLAVTLEGNALVRRGDDGRYRLGLGVLALSRQVQPLLRDVAMPVLRDLAERLAATAFLAVVDSGDALVIAVVEPTVAHISCRVGQRSRLDSCAAGRAVLVARAARERLGVRRDYMSYPVAAESSALSVASAVAGVAGLEAAVGVLRLAGTEAEEVGHTVSWAAGQIAAGLS